MSASRFPDSIESRSSWVAAAITTAILAISYGAPLLIVVGLKPITASLGTDRSVVAVAGALVWVGTGMGGMVMGRVADWIGVRSTVAFGALMAALGLAVSTTGQVWALVLGHAVLIGLLGNSAHFPPLVVYISRWFDRRRGTAVALISSGQYVAGMLWPTVFERTMARFGWQATMLGYAVVVAAAILPLALFLQPPPKPRWRRRGCGNAAPWADIGPAGEPRASIAECRRISVLRADGDARRAPRSILHRSRDPGGAWSRDAVGTARQRLHQPVVLGVARRPDRRAWHSTRRFCLPSLGD